MMLSRDGIAGLVCLAVSVWLFWLTLSLPPAVLVPIGPAFYPRVVIGLTAGLSLLLIIFDLMARRRAAAGPATGAPVPAAQAPNYGLVLATFALFGVYIALLPELGFRISTFLFVAALQITLEWPRTWKQWLLVLIVAVGTMIVCQLVFEDYLSVLLPRGRWSGL